MNDCHAGNDEQDTEEAVDVNIGRKQQIEYPDEDEFGHEHNQPDAKNISAR